MGAMPPIQACLILWCGGGHGSRFFFYLERVDGVDPMMVANTMNFELDLVSHLVVKERLSDGR